MKLDLYGPIATELAERFQASAVLVVIIEGSHGSSYACYGPEGTQERLPSFLVSFAEQLIDDQEAGVNLQEGS